MVSETNSGEKRTASDIEKSESTTASCKLSKIGNFTLAETLLKRYATVLF